MSVAAARSDDDRGHRAGGVGRHVDRQRRDVLVGRPQRSGRFARPERHGLRIWQDGAGPLRAEWTRNEHDADEKDEPAERPGDADHGTADYSGGPRNTAPTTALLGLAVDVMRSVTWPVMFHSRYRPSLNPLTARVSSTVPLTASSTS